MQSMNSRQISTFFACSLLAGIAVFGIYIIVALITTGDFIELARITNPKSETEFVAVDDAVGIGDFGWYVYEVKRGMNVEKNATDQKLLFFNYSEMEVI